MEALGGEVSLEWVVRRQKYPSTEQAKLSKRVMTKFAYLCHSLRERPSTRLGWLVVAAFPHVLEIQQPDIKVNSVKYRRGVQEVASLINM